jgi:hypothetical protein
MNSSSSVWTKYSWSIDFFVVFGEGNDGRYNIIFKHEDKILQILLAYAHIRFRQVDGHCDLDGWVCRDGRGGRKKWGVRDDGDDDGGGGGTRAR